MSSRALSKRIAEIQFRMTGGGAVQRQLTSYRSFVHRWLAGMVQRGRLSALSDLQNDPGLRTLDKLEARYHRARRAYSLFGSQPVPGHIQIEYHKALRNLRSFYTARAGLAAAAKRQEIRDLKQLHSQQTPLHLQTTTQLLGSLASSKGGLAQLAPLLTTAALAAGALAGAVAAVKLGRLVLDATVLSLKFERMRLVFEAFTGSAESSQRIMKTLKDFSTTFPVAINELGSATRVLLATGSTEGGLARELRILSTLAAAANQPLGELATIYGEVRNKDRLYREDLLQFSRRNIPLAEALTDALGITRAELNEMVSEGTIGFDAFSFAMESLIAKGGKYGEVLEKLRESDPLTQWELINNEALLLMANLGDLVTAVLGFENIAEALSTFREGLHAVNTTLAGLTDSVRQAEHPLIFLSKVFTDLGGEIGLFSPVVEIQLEFILDLLEQILKIREKLDFGHLLGNAGVPAPGQVQKPQGPNEADAAKGEAKQAVEARREAERLRNEAAKLLVQAPVAVDKAGLKELERVIENIRQNVEVLKGENRNVVRGEAALAEAREELQIQLALIDANTVLTQNQKEQALAALQARKDALDVKERELALAAKEEARLKKQKELQEALDKAAKERAKELEDLGKRAEDFARKLHPAVFALLDIQKIANDPGLKIFQKGFIIADILNDAFGGLADKVQAQTFSPEAFVAKLQESVLGVKEPFDELKFFAEKGLEVLNKLLNGDVKAAQDIIDALEKMRGRAA